MEKTLNKHAVKPNSNSARIRLKNGRVPRIKKHNIGQAILSSLEAIKEGNIIVIQQNNLEEGIKKLIK